MSSTVLARHSRAGGVVCLIVTALALSACGSNNSDTDVASALGISNGVSLTSSTGSAQMQAGESLTLTATVTADTNNAGVTWVLDGDGSLSGVTSSTATYNSPATVSGTSTPLITATSIANASRTASVTLVVAGAPVIDAVPLFPANADSAYATSISVNGGASPYAWAVTLGVLPAGITNAGNTTYYETISGTPTVTGSYPFQLTVTDNNGRTASVDLTLVVNPAATCLLGGQFVLLSTGISSGSLGTRAASVNIDSAGAISGVFDRKFGGATNVAESLGGSCVNRSGNTGELKLAAASDSPNFNFAVTTGLTEGRVQLTNGGDSASASGLFYQQTPTAFSLAQLTGSFAFGLQGADAGEKRLGLVGQLTVDGSGIVTAGRADSNAATALTSAALTGNMSAPDANGRGTLSLAGGGQSFTLAYYIVTADRLVLVNADSSASAPRLAGFMTRRAASFSGTDLSSPGVLTLWGAASGTQPNTVLAVGRLSAGSASTGAIALVLDTANRSTTATGQSATGASYSVEADGRATLNAAIAGVARSFTFYLDGPANGYVIELSSSVGSAGLLEAQAAGPFNRSMPGLFVSGTQFPQSTSPLILAPVNYISGGSISSSNSSGYAAIDTATGRGIGTISTSGISTTNMALYVVGPSKVVMLRFGTTSQNAAVDWLVK